MSISFLDARNARPGSDGKPLVLRDGQGLDLWVMPSGLKTWRCKVQRDGRRTTVNLGYFPAMSIVEARTARMKIRSAEDPARERREEKERAEVAKGNTLREVAARWIATRSVNEHWTPRYQQRLEERLENHAFPKFGSTPVAEITLEQIGDLILSLARGRKGQRPVQRTAVMLKQHLSAIFDFAVRWRMVPFNPVRQIAVDLPKRQRGEDTPRAHVSTIEDARAVLRAFEAKAPELHPATTLAHRLLALTGVRKEELLGARWSEVDFERAVWTVPAVRMKGKFGRKRDHVVALAPQAIEVLRTAQRIRKGEFVFPSEVRKDRPIFRDTLNRVMATALRESGLGPIMVPHGWRGTFSTIMNERDPSAYRVIEVMIAHKAADGVEARYNHAAYLEARHPIARQWADLLLDGAPTTRALLGLAKDEASNVVQLVPQVGRRAA